MSPDIQPTDGVHSTFSHLCKWCGATVQVVKSNTEPHLCRIEVAS